MSTTSRRRQVREIAAIVGTGIVFLVYENVLRWPKVPFIVACSLAWGAYLVLQLRREPSLIRDWGLHPSMFHPAARPAALVAAAGIVLLLAVRLLRGWTGLPSRALVLMALYPIWALVQQFGIQALISSNLAKLGVSRPVVVAVAAALFGLVHLPDWALVGLCAVAGVAWTTIFLRTPHLVPLAFSHAVLGTLAYYWLLERDPWFEMFPES